MTPRIAVCLLFGGILPFAGAAQEVDAYRSRLERLRDTWQVARAAADSADRALAGVLEVDTIRVGNVMVLAPPGNAGPVRRGAESAWQTVSTALGRDTVLLDHVAFFFPDFAVRSGVPEMAGWELYPIRVRDGNRTVYRERIISWVSTILSARVDTTFTRWLGRTIPVTTRAPDLTTVQGEFITSPSFLTHECRNGNVRSCRVALGLDSVTNRTTEWYDAQGRADLVAGWPGLVRRDFEARDVCVERGWDQVCLAILEAAEGSIPPPLSPAVRTALAAFAIRRGGPGAFGRALAADLARDPGAVLGAFAGMPVDSLLSEWRTTVLRTESPTVLMEVRSGVAAAAWVGLLLGIAMTNRRWR